MDSLVKKGREIYNRRGASYTLWWFIKTVWLKERRPIRFQEAFEFHRAVANVRSKYSTWRALRRLVDYGLIDNINGYYRPLVLDESIVNGAIDRKRVRKREQIVKGRMKKSSKNVIISDSIPEKVRKVIEVARELIEKGEKWRAVDLMGHTLLGLRKTGTLIGRWKDLFIYYENKTGKMHMIRSEKIAKIFDMLGIKDDILVEHRYHEADDLIHRLFRSHDVARRLHYMLKELGWFDYPADNYFYRLFEGINGVWIIIYRMENGRMIELFTIGKREEVGIQKKAGPIVAKEHVEEKNEETYFNRSKSLP